MGCIPPSCWPYPGMHCAGGCLPRGCLPRGCLPRSGSAQGDVYPGGCLPRGVSAQGGVCRGEVSASGPRGGCIPACNGQTTPLWTDRHLWKHDLSKLRLRAVINENLILFRFFICIFYGVAISILAAQTHLTAAMRTLERRYTNHREFLLPF